MWAGLLSLEGVSGAEVSGWLTPVVLVVGGRPQFLPTWASPWAASVSLQDSYPLYPSRVPHPGTSLILPVGHQPPAVFTVVRGKPAFTPCCNGLETYRSPVPPSPRPRPSASWGIRGLRGLSLRSAAQGSSRRFLFPGWGLNQALLDSNTESIG